MFRAEKFTLAKCWKHPNCSVIDWRLSTFWYQCNGIPQKEWHIWSDKYRAYVDTEKSIDEAYFNTEKLYKQKKYMLTKILYLFADQEYSYNKSLICCFWSLLSSPSLLLSGDHHCLYFLYTQVPLHPIQLGLQLQGFTGTTLLPRFSSG